jgi:hypothetical protein
VVRQDVVGFPTKEVFPPSANLNIHLNETPHNSADGSVRPDNERNFGLRTNCAVRTRFIYQAILIATNIQGPVVLDLKGFTLTGNNLTAISIGSGTAPNTYPITIKNGIISGRLDTTPGGVPFPATEITIDHVTFLTSPITFTQVSNSTVKNCTFQEVGIRDLGSPGGNRYINLTFINNRTGALPISPTNDGQSAPVLTLEHCGFAPPAN